MPLPQMTAVTSSQISEVGYDAQMKELYVRFRTSGVYRYEEVPKEVVDAMMKAPSVGQYFHRNVRGAYSFERV